MPDIDDPRAPSVSIPSPRTGIADELPSIGQIVETLTFQAGYNTSLVVAGTTLLGLAAGVIGVFALLRKRSLMADALSHATLPGIVLAFLSAGWLGFEGRSLPVLLLGATVTGVLGVASIQALLRHSRLREDAAIGIVLSVFFGIGIVGLSYIQTNAPTGSAGLNTFIYGQAATMQPPDVMLMGGIVAIAVLATVLFLKEFAIVCFNDGFARVDGWPVTLIDLVMMGLVVLVTVAGLQAVGLILVIAMLIIPPVAARFWTERLWMLVVLAGVVGAASGYFGSVLSALLPRKPAGAVIVLTSGGLFLFSMLAAPSRGVIALMVRHARSRLRIAGDHVLELAYERGTDRLTWSDLARLAAIRAWSPWYRWVVLTALTLSGGIKRDAAGAVMVQEAGLERGARVRRNHLLWEQYLIQHADIAASHVDWSVDQVEHVLEPSLILRLEAIIQATGIDLPRGRGGTV